MPNTNFLFGQSIVTCDMSHNSWLSFPQPHSWLFFSFHLYIICPNLPSPVLNWLRTTNSYRVSSDPFTLCVGSFIKFLRIPYCPPTLPAIFSHYRISAELVLWPWPMAVSFWLQSDIRRIFQLFVENWGLVGTDLNK